MPVTVVSETLSFTLQDQGHNDNTHYAVLTFDWHW